MTRQDDLLAELAKRALRKNQPRPFQMSWDAVVELPNQDEMAYMKAASPDRILRLLGRVRDGS